MTKNKAGAESAALPDGSTIDDAKRYRITLTAPVELPRGVMLRPGEDVRVSGKVLRQIISKVDGAPVEV